VVSRDVVFWEVDTQADFMLPGGKLYVPGAEKLVSNIARLVQAAREDRVFLVSDACQHSLDDDEFRDFPPHCVRGTPGAAIIPEALAAKVLTVPSDSGHDLPENFQDFQQIVLEKQTLDVFHNPHTGEVVEHLGRQPHFVVFGVVTEYCVRCVTLGLLHRGRRVSVVQDAIETLDAAVGKRTLEEFVAQGAKLITTEQALALLPAS
jgi:nicotinamidase/pyrazinamidase